MSKLRIPERLKPFLFIPPVLLGIAALVWIAASRKGPERRSAVEQPQAVRFIVASKSAVVPRVTAYGTAHPANTWRGVVQVKGRITEKHDHLQAGAILDAGAVLARIDRRHYDLAVQEIEAGLAELAARQREAEIRKNSTEQLLALETANLELATAELDRQKKLLADGASSAALVDQESRNVLGRKTKVQELQNQRALITAEQATLRASAGSLAARLDTARLDQAHTEMRAPYACQVAAVQFERDQFVGVGQEIVSLHGLDAVEVTANVAPQRIRPLVPEQSPAPDLQQFVANDLLKRLGLTAEVRTIGIPGAAARWQARVARLAPGLDPRTRTVGVVVVVEKPWEKVKPGQRPPLLDGMYCEVELRGAARPDRVLIPRAAIHGSDVYLIDAENRLRRKHVDVEFELQEFACIRAGIQAGERVIASDPVPAIDGGLLQGTRDDDLEARIAAASRGPGNPR
ncbi:MAG: hypothetical protein H6836_02045 [Planctomycetes bacterium]|nr:hypothetical protein [Planctomycetota bacterium]MCB9888329.1 hypothetical protein [Planctomycetota bacterium]